MVLVHGSLILDYLNWRTLPDTICLNLMSTALEQTMNSFPTTILFVPLRWTFSDRAKNVIFLDLNITIRNQSIHMNIYEKKLNLYLYLPQHSCHSPGCLKGLIFGFTVRAKNLCTEPSDHMPFICKSYARLLKRGYCSVSQKFDLSFSAQFLKSCITTIHMSPEPTPILICQDHYFSILNTTL